MIEIKEITKDYGQGKGVLEINLKLEKGIIGFIGKNGAGKTTLINLIMGLLYPDSGEIIINNLKLWNKDNTLSIKKLIGFLPDDDFLYNKLTGRENLEIISLFKTGHKDWYWELENLLKHLDIYDALDQTFLTYSKGMKKKLQICASLIGYPEILIWDEFHNGLDIVSNIEIKHYLKEYSQKRNRLIFFSSHIIEIVQDLCESTIIIHHGRIKRHLINSETDDLTTVYLKEIQLQ